MQRLDPISETLVTEHLRVLTQDIGVRLAGSDGDRRAIEYIAAYGRKLGATVTVETLDGDVELELPAGTQPGDVRVLRGKGMPVLQGFGRGDQRVLLNVTVPRRLTDEQRRLLAEFEASADEHTYRHDESFFEKLKSAFR